MATGEINITPLRWYHFGAASTTINLALVGKDPLNLWFTRAPYRNAPFSPAPADTFLGRICARSMIREYDYTRVVNDGQAVLLMKSAPADRRSAWLEKLLTFLWGPIAGCIEWLFYPPEPLRRKRFREMFASAVATFIGPGKVPPGHMYLHMLATHPTQVGRGLGNALLVSACRDADLLDRRIFLFSTDSKNETYYQRFGFETLTWLEPPSEDWEPKIRCPVMVRAVGATGPALSPKKA